MIIIVDFDRCVCNVSGRLLQRFKDHFPSLPLPDFHHVKKGSDPLAYFSNKKSKAKAQEILSEDGFYDAVDAVPGSINALHEMKSLKHDVRLFVELGDDFLPTVLSAKMKWIERRLSKDWVNKIVLAREVYPLLREDAVFLTSSMAFAHVAARNIFILNLDNTIDVDTIKCQYLESYKAWKSLVSGASSSFSSTSSTSSTSSSSASTSSVVSSTTAPEINGIKALAWFRHGSADSLDLDVIYQFPSMPSFKDCLDFAKGVPEDRNVIAISDGNVSDCYKGIPDEVNNELFMNYRLHEQLFPLPIRSKVQRCVAVRVVVAIRSILIQLRRVPSIRQAVVSALESKVISDRIKVIEALRFSKMGKEASITRDDWKYLAFRIAQTVALVNGVELFTKSSLAEKFRDIKMFLYREKEIYEEEDLRALDDLRGNLVKLLAGCSFVMSGDLVLFSIEGAPSNLFQAQSRGVVIDIQAERCVHFPCIHLGKNSNNASLPNCEWPLDDESKLIDHHDAIYGFFKFQNKSYWSNEKAFLNATEAKAMSAELNSDQELKAEVDIALAFHFVTLGRDGNQRLRIVAKRSKITNLLV